MTGIGKIPPRVSGYSAFASARTRHITKSNFAVQKVMLGAGDGANVQQKSVQINCG
jgi:hypothetical protein